MNEQFLEPFIYGLGVGIIGVVVVYLRETTKRSQYKKEIKSLKNHLHQKMEIDAEATDHKKKEIEKLKKENENLRITNQSLSQKPDKKEVFALHTYQKAIDKMSESLVGFAPAWQKALKEAEVEVDQIQEGKKSFVRRIIPRQFLSGSDNTIEINTSKSDEEKGGSDKSLFE